jgi:tetratricopeptide (TPR) repeat protein
MTGRLRNTFAAFGHNKNLVFNGKRFYCFSKKRANAIYEVGICPEPAVVNFKRAPKRTEAKFLLAQANLLLGKPTEAKLLVQEILATDPKNSDARWQQAIFLKDEGKVVEALLIVEDLILKDYVFRSFSDIAWVVQSFEKQKKYQQAIGLYEKYLTSDPSNLPYMIDLVRVYKLAGEQNKALNLANAILKLDSTKQKELEEVLNLP